MHAHIAGLAGLTPARRDTLPGREPSAFLTGAKLGHMTTREKAHKLLDELPEDELGPVVEILASRGTSATDPAAADGPVTELDEPEIAPLPQGWGSLPSGAPAPNWVAGLDDVRSAR